MRAHRNRRVDQACAILDLQPLDCIGIITGPYLRHIVEHTRVKTPAAARAALEQHIREFLIEFLQDAV